MGREVQGDSAAIVIKFGFPVLLAAALLAAPAAAQEAVPVIAVPPLATPEDRPTSAGSTLSLAWQATQLIAADLQSVSDVMALPTDQQKDFYSYPEVTAPTYSKWRAKGAKAVLTGFVQARADGRLAVGCYIYDVEKGRELGRTGFVVSADDWRRAAHKCSGLAYEKLTGAPGVFDTRIAYVAKSGAGPAQVARIAVMDGDAQNHTYITGGDSFALTPRLSPTGQRLAYVSFSGGKPHVRIVDLANNEQRPLIPGDAISFAPRYSPDGSRLVFSMSVGGNTDVYVVNAAGGMPQRLTSSPGVDTAASFSPDSSQIVFESDRSGSQQLYVMNANGSDQRRLSFGGAWYASPEWSPDGKRIAFVRRATDGLRIGVMNVDGSEQQVLTSGPRDEGPSWAVSSRELLFQRTEGFGRSGIYRIGIAGGQPRKVAIPQDGADPDWSGAGD
jgi:TolB protein